MSDHAYAQIRYELTDHVLVVTLDRPDRRNAFTPVMADELVDAFARADADDDVRAVVLTGEGAHFCAGADLQGGESTFDSSGRPSTEDLAGRVSLAVYRSLKPVIVAFEGVAVGVGITMALPADLRIASTRSRFGFVFVRRGIVLEGAAGWFLPRLVGVGKALEWNVTGRLVEADEALSAGLVTELREPGEVLPRAMEIAREIAENAAPVAVALTRRLIWSGLGQAHPMDAHQVDSAVLAERGASPDAREGVTSFLEKRPAEFPDRVSTDLPSTGGWWEEREYQEPDAST